MPPKTRFIKDDAITAAMELVQEKGFPELTMRKVAERLGSSLQPVYSCFESKFELEQTVIEEIKKIIFSHATKMYTPSQPLNMAIGQVLFARDYAQLFSSIFLQDREFKDVFQEFNRYHVEKMETIDRFARLDDQGRQKILSRLWIFTFGFATLMCAGLVEDISDENVIATLQQVGAHIIDGALADDAPAMN